MATKTANPTVTEYSAETGETIVRSMTQEELDSFNAFFNEVELLKKAEEATLLEQAKAKEELLNRLGITADEAKLLLA